MDLDWTVVATGAAVVGGLAMVAAMNSGPPGVKVPESYSYIVPGTEDVSQGLGSIYRSVLCKNELMEKLSTGQETGYEVFQKGVQTAGDGDCMGRRQVTMLDGKPVAGPFVYESYNTVNQRIIKFSSGLVVLGLIPHTPGSDGTGPMRLLALYMKNRPEWIIAEQACFRYSASTVPMYDTLGADTVEMILNETELATVLCTPAEIKSLLKVKDMCPSLKNIIYVDEVPNEVKAEVEAAGLKLLSFAEVEEAGASQPVDPQPPKPDDIATFCYTSGTTGKSKGALLSHRNMVSVIASVDFSMTPYDIVIGPEDRHLSYLPLAHVFERAVIGLMFSKGAKVGFFQGETPKLPEDLATLRPTIFPSVPRLLNRFYDKIMGGVKAQGGLKAKLFNMGYAAKQQGLKDGYLTHALWDKLVFSKVSKKLGLDGCKLLITGSAPIAPHVIEFLRILLSCNVVEGYGQTEGGAGATIQTPGDYSAGNVGAPISANEIRLVSVPEMGYLVEDRIHGKNDATGNPGIPCMGRGEICFTGPNVFKGYFKMDDKTAEAIDADGWVHTGDIGIWTPKGQLKIVDRKKNIFKLAQGEYIAPEKIENVYTKCEVVAQAFVYGDSFQHQLVAIIVLDAEALPAFCRDKGLPAGSPAEMCKSEEMKKAVLAELDRLRKEAKLLTFEHAAKIYLESEPFSVENDILTPTFKLKRDIAKKVYETQIDAMYDSLGRVGKQG